MIITFCGHRDFYPKISMAEKMVELLENIIGDRDVSFYLGGYGGFDSFAYGCCREYKLKHPNTKLCLILAYYQHKKDDITDYYCRMFDNIIYPPLERVLKRYAIIHRNRWIVNNADVLIAGVKYTFGGAWQTLEYARKKKINIVMFDCE